MAIRHLRRTTIYHCPLMHSTADSDRCPQFEIVAHRHFVRRACQRSSLSVVAGLDSDHGAIYSCNVRGSDRVPGANPQSDIAGLRASFELPAQSFCDC